MPKVTKIYIDKANRRKAAIEALKQRGPASNENGVNALRERVALLEEILGVAED